MLEPRCGHQSHRDGLWVFGTILSQMSPGSGSRSSVPAMGVSAIAFFCPPAANPPWAHLTGVKTFRCCCSLLGSPSWNREAALAFPRTRLQLSTRTRFHRLLPRNSDTEAATSIPTLGVAPWPGMVGWGVADPAVDFAGWGILTPGLGLAVGPGRCLRESSHFLLADTVFLLLLFWLFLEGKLQLRK